MSIQNTAITTTPVAIYTSTGNTVVSTVHILNYSNSPLTANVWVVPMGLSTTPLTQIYSTYTITALNTLIMQEKFALSDGDAIYASVSTDDTSASSTVSYVGM
jgi:hypothetical protein